MDGVFVTVNKLYGVSVYADRESVEVKTFQHNLRNQACGLCGDLNDEKVADMKSAGNCLMTAPKFAAYSYMVADGKCQGIPAQDKQTFLQEATKCMKRVVFPTKVTKVLQQKPQIKFRHLVQERDNKICFSKKQVKVCWADATPKEVIMKEVPFFCVARDYHGFVLRRMAEFGEKIENAGRFRNEYIRHVSEPLKC